MSVRFIRRCKKEVQKELEGRRVVNVFLVICCPFFDSSPFKPDDDTKVVEEGVLKFLYKLRETETETTAIRLCVMFNELWCLCCLSTCGRFVFKQRF